MRVISGNVRGLRLSAPEGLDTRPTLDRVKEAVFSMLAPHLMNSVVLDAFAGSGALGIEALSRGAKEAVFVDNNKSAVKCIKENICAAHFEACSTVYFGSIFDYLKKSNAVFDIVFLDPPYAENRYTAFLEAVSQSNLINDDTIIVAEWSKEAEKPYFDCGFKEVKTKFYGRVAVTLLKRG